MSKNVKHWDTRNHNEVDVESVARRVSDQPRVNVYVEVADIKFPSKQDCDICC